MRLVAAGLAVEITLAVAVETGWLAAAVLRLKTLHRALVWPFHQASLGGTLGQPCPGIDQRAIDREVIVREQVPHLQGSQRGSQEAMGDIAVQQPVAVLGEYRHVPHRRFDRQADEPTEQDVAGQPCLRLTRPSATVLGKPSTAALSGS